MIPWTKSIKNFTVHLGNKVRISHAKKVLSAAQEGKNAIMHPKSVTASNRTD
jgi:hypothetical protein